MFITQPQDRARECGLMSADGKFPNHFQISKLDKLKAGGFYKNIQIGKNVAASQWASRFKVWDSWTRKNFSWFKFLEFSFGSGEARDFSTDPSSMLLDLKCRLVLWWWGQGCECVMMFKAKVMHRVLKLRLNGFKQVLVVLDIRRERQLSDLGWDCFWLVHSAQKYFVHKLCGIFDQLYQL